jgi:hypothetical protein
MDIEGVAAGGDLTLLVVAFEHTGAQGGSDRLYGPGWLIL